MKALILTSLLGLNLSFAETPKSLTERYNSYVDMLQKCGQESHICHNEALVPEPGRFMECMKEWFLCIEEVKEVVFENEE